jgi:hypothetical protein
MTLKEVFVMNSEMRDGAAGDQGYCPSDVILCSESGNMPCNIYFTSLNLIDWADRQ